MKDKLKKKLKKIIPFVLVGFITSTSIFLSYDRANEVKAAFVVDDLALMISLFAMCGIAYTGLEYYYANGQWLDDTDSPVSDPDTQKKVNDLLDRSRKHWDEDVRKKALEKGLIDEDGNILSGGSSGSGGDDSGDDKKFPSWSELKKKVAENNGLISDSITLLSPFIALYGFEGYRKAYGGLKKSPMESLEKAESSLSDYLKNNDISLSDMPYYSKVISAYKNADSGSDDWYRNIEIVYAKDMVRSDDSFIVRGSYVQFDFKVYDNGNIEISKERSDSGMSVGVDLSSSYFLSNASYKNDDDSSLLFNPDSIGLDSSFKDNVNNLPTSPFYNFAKLPTIEDLKDLIKKNKENKDDKDKKQKDIDDFIKKITTADTGGGETPNPNPSPDPGGGGSGGGGGGTTTDTPDKPDKDDDNSKKDYARDLQKIFPFCIPFDIVDCFKLFKAEPETPRVEIPIHFGIVEKDYTFVIDLKDFNNVALMLRSSLLIVFVVGLGFATRNVIKW